MSNHFRKFWSQFPSFVPSLLWDSSLFCSRRVARFRGPMLLIAFLKLSSLFCSRGLLNSEEQCFWLLFWIGAVFGPLVFWREWPSTCFSWRIYFLSCMFPKRWLSSRRRFCFLCMFLTCLVRFGSKEPLIFGLPQQRSSSFWIRLVLLDFLQPFLNFLWRVFSLKEI